VSRVLVIGAGGIVGQTMRRQQPAGHEVRYTRRRAGLFYDALDVDAADRKTWEDALASFEPDVVVNLAGENRPDVVERASREFKDHLLVNRWFPVQLGEWCDRAGKLLIHVSTQGVFDGRRAPYGAIGPDALAQLPPPVNAYGSQKRSAEVDLAERCRRWVIVRPTFVLGVRPLPQVGRQNPAEAILEGLARGEPQRQVHDRDFSPCFALDAADALWDLVARGRPGQVVHVGTPVTTSRAALARGLAEAMGADPGLVTTVRHADFGRGLAERPLDTSYAAGTTRWWTDYGVATGLNDIVHEWRNRFRWESADDRALELATFFGMPDHEARARLAGGFLPLHAAVAEDWRRAHPETDDEILAWYRGTAAYCWELTAYHLDTGFNYRGMCRGIAAHCGGVGAKRVLCLGDGIGDLTLELADAGLEPVYHDLMDSVTARFAAFRFARRQRPISMALSTSWGTGALVPEGAEAVVALDFFEHLPNVEAWAEAAFADLRPGGWLLAQNAFGIGDEAHEGSIPMHLVRNNRFVKDWDPLLARIGFVRSDPWNGWWQKP
jgi:dTDP-4-dehydrorhamnose reductase